jgi:hypothetical protein
MVWHAPLDIQLQDAFAVTIVAGLLVLMVISVEAIIAAAVYANGPGVLSAVFKYAVRKQAWCLCLLSVLSQHKFAMLAMS